MADSLQVYIDESGDTKPRGDKNSEFFVIGAVVVHDGNLETAIKKAKKDIGKERDYTFKSFKEINNEKARWALCHRFSEENISTISVIIHKSELKEEWRDHVRDLYYYASKFLLERISWICEKGKQKAKITFSEMRSFDYEDFLSRLNNVKGINWDYLNKDDIKPKPHRSGCPGLLAADYFASSVGKALEYKDLRLFDGRFAFLFQSTMYRNEKGKLQGYGVKLWPSKDVDLLKSDERFWWYREMNRVRG